MGDKSLPGLTEVHVSLGPSFGLGFLQIPHWQTGQSMVNAIVESRVARPALLSALRLSRRLPAVSLGTLALPYSLPPF